MRTQMLMPKFRTFVGTVVAIAVLMSAQTAAFAHFIWATIEEGQVRFALLENIAEKPNARFEKYVVGLSPRSGDKTLIPGAPKDGAVYAGLPPGQNVVTAESIVGAKEREGEAYLLVYHAKGAATLAAADMPTKAPADIVARREGETLTVLLRQNGKGIAETEIWTQWPGDTQPASAKTDGKGEARFPWPKNVGERSGFVGIRAMVKEAKAGEAEGKKYAAIHRWVTLTFPFASSRKVVAASESADRPFTRILREAYGDNHDVVNGAEFNKTLFAGKLTQTQLESHLLQRALVHAEVDRILSAAPAETRLPYGRAQKEVLTLLCDDLKTLGIDKLDGVQVRPITRDFLREIDASARRGPYFALGVFHVYYGGVTNGGRMIGRQIGETLKFTPTYYARSNGYREYLAEVNRIADPQSRAEMIRGGQSAYRYIIASMNEALFKPSMAQP